jgi:hypothetical protein
MNPTGRNAAARPEVASYAFSLPERDIASFFYFLAISFKYRLKA